MTGGVRSVVIAGLGLIGGSLARDLAARGVRVFAWEHDVGALRAAMDARIARPALWDEPVDVVVLAVPVLAALELLPRIVERVPDARLFTDVGSTKGSIVRAAEALGIGARFVGSHPLAGDHRSGWEASREGLFEGARVFLSPAPSAEDDAVRIARELWTSVGAHPEQIDAAEHDRRLAWTSHLPQLVSSALGLALAGQGIARDELGPGGRDVTRLAGSSPAMWADVAADNAAELAPALREAEERLREIRTAIEGENHVLLRDRLEEARGWHGG